MMLSSLWLRNGTTRLQPRSSPNHPAASKVLVVLVVWLKSNDHTLESLADQLCGLHKLWAPFPPWHALSSCLGGTFVPCFPPYCSHLVGQGKVFSPYSMRDHSRSVGSGQDQSRGKSSCLSLHRFFPPLSEASGVGCSQNDGTAACVPSQHCLLMNKAGSAVCSLFTIFYHLGMHFSWRKKKLKAPEAFRQAQNSKETFLLRCSAGWNK